MTQLTKLNIANFFKDRIGYFPYEYQLNVCEKLLSGTNVILSVPTGAGKTWASVIPFLFAQCNTEIHFPKKMIYSLPLRTLVNSIFEDVSNVVEDSSIQTGEYSEDKYFEKDIIFSTIDQTLSNFMCFPLPLSDSQANINAGALIGSYLVFDEFHLLDEKLSMATTIGMLKMLGNLTRCCIMTATLSNGFMQLLKAQLTNYEIITLDDFPADKLKIGSLKPEIDKKTIEVRFDKLSVTNIIEKHKSKTIVICNQVESAQEIYNQLVEKITTYENVNIRNVKILCLHSRFFDIDRKDKEKELKKLFGKDANNESVILVSTQVIEAGMDLSCDVMHTEISPINSFLQRAGRCARFNNQTGQIFIYDILNIREREQISFEVLTKEDNDEIKKLNKKYLPYDQLIIEKTFTELQKYKTLDGNIPNQLIEAVLGTEEQKIITRMQTGHGGGFNQDKIRESWNHCKKNFYRNSIRDIQSIEITLISDSMEKEIIKYPNKFQSLGMYKWSFVGWLNKIIQSENYDHEDWLIKELEENTFIGEVENDEDVYLQLTKITNFKNLPNHVYANSKYFGYSTNFGFNWLYKNTFNFISPRNEFIQLDGLFKPLAKDTFYQHNMGLVKVFEQEFLGINGRKLDFVFTELALYIHTPELKKEDFIRLIYLMILLHDYGKLNTLWQRPMQEYQKLKEISMSTYTEILAHTDYDRNNSSDKTLAIKTALHKRPPHAGVGAFVAEWIIPQIWRNNDYLKSSVSMAIARHHNSLSDSYPDFNITDSNFQAMQLLLDKLEFKVELPKHSNTRGNIEGFVFEGYHEHLLYLFFVRILRLCDQKATENLRKYFND